MAAVLLAQPGSAVRTMWNAWRADAAAKQAVRRHWDDLVTVSSPLYPGVAMPQVIEFSDYECPYCRQSSPVVDSAIAAGARVAYVHYPLPSHVNAGGAALAAVCAEKAGRLREMHGRLMHSAEWRTDANWIREAELAGVRDLSRFRDCLVSAEARGRLELQRRLADSIGVLETPTFVSLTARHRGVISVERLKGLARD